MIPNRPLTSLKITGDNLKQTELSDIMNLKPGRIVNAKVLDVTSENRIQLLVNGQKLTVSSQLPLTRGMDISMKVVRSRDGIALMPAPTSSASKSIDTAGTAVNTGRRMPSVPAGLPDSNSPPGPEKSSQKNAFQSVSPVKIFQGLNALSRTREPILNDILMGLSLKSDVRNDQFLPQIIKNMGLSFEKKLVAGFEDGPDKKTVAHGIKQLAGKDLKAAALSLAGMENDPGKATVLKHISDALDNFAQLNVKSGDGGQTQDGARFLLPFPVWRENGFDFGQLMVDTGKTGTANTGKKMLSISFLLNMTALGPLRADFSILDKTIAGRFLLENQATCDYLTPKISELRQRLSGIGYQAGSIDCRVARPEQIAPTSLMHAMKAPDDMQGLNIVV
ncbi:flagellar hook-length control protein FliK [Desulfobacter sp.]